MPATQDNKIRPLEVGQLNYEVETNYYRIEKYVYESVPPFFRPRQDQQRCIVVISHYPILHGSSDTESAVTPTPVLA